MVNSQDKEITSWQWAGLVSPTDWEYLSQHLSEDTLRSLLSLLDGCDRPVREALIAQTRGLAESHRDRAVFLAWARVAYTNDPLRPDDQGGGP